MLGLAGGPAGRGAPTYTILGYNVEAYNILYHVSYHVRRIVALSFVSQAGAVGRSNCQLFEHAGTFRESIRTTSHMVSFIIATALYAFRLI